MYMTIASLCIGGDAQPYLALGKGPNRPVTV